MERYDLIVIGAGPAGYVGAIRAAQLGLSVALVEKDRALGGTCLNRGCIPTKVLLHAAEFMALQKEFERLGIKAGEFSLDLQKLMKTKQSVVRRLGAGVASLLKQNGVKVLQGFARLKTAQRVEVQFSERENSLLEGRFILLAPGSEPSQLPTVPMDGKRIVSSNEALEFDEVPENLLVIGAGAVGVELGLVWARFGSKVTVVELLPSILPGADKELTAELTTHLKDEGIEILTNSVVSAVRPKNDLLEVTITRKETNKEEKKAFQKVLVAVGRKACLEGIGLDNVGIQPEKGRIAVDPFGRTQIENIFAAGDAVPGPQLAHLASAEAVLCVETMAGKKPRPINRRAIPSCVYTDPEVATVGLTEEEARKNGKEPLISKFPFLANGKAMIEGKQVGWVKAVGDPETGEILGVHIIGPHATELIAEAVLAIQLECTFEELSKTIHAHPTLSEALMEAGHGGEEGPIHLYAPRKRAGA